MENRPAPTSKIEAKGRRPPPRSRLQRTQGGAQMSLTSSYRPRASAPSTTPGQMFGGDKPFRNAQLGCSECRVVGRVRCPMCVSPPNAPIRLPSEHLARRLLRAQGDRGSLAEDCRGACRCLIPVARCRRPRPCFRAPFLPRSRHKQQMRLFDTLILESQAIICRPHALPEEKPASVPVYPIWSTRGFSCRTSSCRVPTD